MKPQSPVLYRHKKNTIPRSNWSASIFTGLALLVLGAVLGITVERFLQERKLQQFAQNEQSAQEQLIGLKREQGLLQSQLAIEVAAKEQFSSDLQKAQQTIHGLREDLTFYELLVPQEGATNALQIRSAEALQYKPDTLTVKVLLIRLNPSNDLFNGQVHFIAQGMQNDKRVSVAVFPINQPSDSEIGPMAISFSQFSRLEAVLSVPSGLMIDKLTIRVQNDANLLSSTTVNVLKQSESPAP